MRFADILVDLAAVANASRGVAAHHAALRARQLERYGKTSSIVAAVKARTRAGDAASAGRSSAAPHTPSPSPSSARPEGQTSDVAGSTGGNDPSVKATETAAPPRAAHIPHVRPGEGVDTPVTSQDLFGTSSVLRQLRGGAGPKLSGAKEVYGAGNMGKPEEAVAVDAESGIEAIKETSTAEPEAPPGVDMGVFRTPRLSKPSAQPKRPQMVRDIAAPSWLAPEFADHGHGTPSALAGTGAAEVEQPAITSTAQSVEPARPDRPEQPEQPAPTSEAPISEAPLSQVPAEAQRPYVLRESKVPASRMSRLWNYGGLAAGMLGGAISESISRAVSGSDSSTQGSVLLSSANMERLVSKLSRMRGAALKLGQMMSFQDAKMLPGPIQEVLQRVQDRADYMPARQRDAVLVANLGKDWRDLFGEFEETPIAAASIGQVHRATLRSSGQRVAVKIQFPGVADSINSDLDNLGVLLTATKLLPKGLYLDKTIANARLELGWECDYEREARCAVRYKSLLADEGDVFAVPGVHPEASGKQVLTMDFMDGVGVTRVAGFTQEQRDWIGTQILRLCLREIAEFRFMQTDPNWTNFLFDAAAGDSGASSEKRPAPRIALLDFGASRDFSAEFAARYVQLLAAASRTDRDAVRSLSESLGYLTGHESRAMLEAHIGSVTTLAEPFLASAPEVYDFRDQTITERVRGLIPVMLKERLAPPPEETYSLHRKLSGAFLLCARLGSQVRCRELFENALAKSEIPDASA